MVDLVLAIVLLLAAIGGWSRGLLTSALSLIGVVAGLLAGLWLAPRALAVPALADLSTSGRFLAQIIVVVVSVIVLTACCEAVARSLLRSVSPGPARTFDSALGAIAALTVTAFVLWLGASAVRPALPGAASAALDDSRVLSTLDSGMPPLARQAPARFQDALQASGFPEVFSGLTAEPILKAPPPTGEGADTVAVREAADSVLKIRSESPACSTVSSGSGWTLASERVVTNAHVVAGGREVTVQVGGQGRRLQATVVAFDPELDLAILAVPGLRADPLPRAGALEPGTEGAVAGFPGGGPYTVTPARVASTIQAQGQDIYGASGADREVYPMHADVREGDSGGPLLTADGRVAGTVFAKSLDQPQVGYALTDAATAHLLDEASVLRSEVPTGECLAR